MREGVLVAVKVRTLDPARTPESPAGVLVPRAPGSGPTDVKDQHPQCSGDFKEQKRNSNTNGIVKMTML